MVAELQSRFGDRLGKLKTSLTDTLDETWKRAMGSRQSAVSSQQSAVGSQQSAVSRQQSAVSQPSTVNREPDDPGSYQQTIGPIL
ncbi:hypothetical protein M1N79_04370 [Dehalococcoidia bacterium]|nr:hypothetical protein [Dehalococcoidia bacterium]